jgi:hypothetical protein
VRCNQLDALDPQLGIERIRIISAIADQSSRLLTSETRRRSVSDKGDGHSGAALVWWAATGRPKASAATIRGEPMPRFVLPTRSPLF